MRRLKQRLATGTLPEETQRRVALVRADTTPTLARRGGAAAMPFDHLGSMSHVARSSSRSTARGRTKGPAAFESIASASALTRVLSTTNE